MTLKALKWLKKKISENPRLATITLVTIVCAFILDASARLLFWYETYPNIDIAIHFGWGVGMSLVLFLFSKLRTRDVFEIMIIGNLLFEFGEMWQDKILPQPAYMKDVFFWDGFFDIVVGLIGVGIGWIIFRRSLNQPILPWQLGEKHEKNNIKHR